MMILFATLNLHTMNNESMELMKLGGCISHTCDLDAERLLETARELLRYSSGAELDWTQEARHVILQKISRVIFGILYWQTSLEDE